HRAGGVVEELRCTNPGESPSAADGHGRAGVDKVNGGGRAAGEVDVAVIAGEAVEKIVAAAGGDAEGAGVERECADGGGRGVAQAGGIERRAGVDDDIAAGGDGGTDSQLKRGGVAEGGGSCIGVGAVVEGVEAAGVEGEAG